MTVQELITYLSQHPPEMPVMILEGFNGNGVPRTINVGPKTVLVTQADENDTSDCEGLVGQTVCALGYGSY